MFHTSRPHRWPDQTRGRKGFTLFEVALAISIGLIIIGGVAIGYAYGKKATIANNQRVEVQSFRSFVENARAAKQDAGTTNYGPALNIDQMCGMLSKIPSMQLDPYSGTTRTPYNFGSTCATGSTGSTTTYVSLNYAGGSVPSSISKGSDVFGDIAGSSVVYLSCDNTLDTACVSGTTAQTFNFSLINGITETTYGYAVFETDGDGNVIAVAGGTKS